jgi:hypothetical protein
MGIIYVEYWPEGLRMYRLISIAFLLLPFLLTACGAGGGGVSGPFTVSTYRSEPPPGTPASNSSLKVSAIPKERTVAPGTTIKIMVTIIVPGSSGHYVDIRMTCPEHFICPAKRTEWMSGTRKIETSVEVSRQAVSGRYTVRISGASPQGAGGPFSGDSANVIVHVKEASESLSLVRTVIDPGPIEGDSWQINSLENITLSEPLALKDVTAHAVSGDMDSDGQVDHIAWEAGPAGRKLVLSNGGTESDPHRNRILRVEQAPLDQAGGLLLLWRTGYPFASLVTPQYLYLNEDGRLANPPRPNGWDLGVPVRLVGGDMNRDGFDDVLYFPASGANWFAVVLSTGDGGFDEPVKFIEPDGVRAAVVTDIDMDGNADVVIMGNSSLVLWSG